MNEFLDFYVMLGNLICVLLVGWEKCIIFVEWYKYKDYL